MPRASDRDDERPDSDSKSAVFEGPADHPARHVIQGDDTDDTDGSERHLDRGNSPAGDLDTGIRRYDGLSTERRDDLMPEGPEIKRAAERIAEAIVGRVACRVEFAFERLKPYGMELEGRRVLAVEARGKAMITRFEDTPVRIYSHNQLYGRWRTSKPGTLPKTNRSLRLAIHTEHRSALLYSASDIRVLQSDAEERKHPYLERLGPDLLDTGVGSECVRARLEDRRFARRGLAGLYLDQSFLSGPGNYLRSEILFCAGLHPKRRPCDLSPKERMRLADASLRITRRAYDLRGVTVAEEEVARLKDSGATRRQYRHYVFARSGHPCRVCGTSIEKTIVGGRRLYRCPHCQPLQPRVAAGDD